MIVVQWKRSADELSWLFAEAPRACWLRAKEVKEAGEYVVRWPDGNRSLLMVVESPEGPRLHDGRGGRVDCRANVRVLFYGPLPPPEVQAR